ncbi:hypothetical protein [Streptococcus suis]|uniref:hypothetical protein n=1 Tax=Streptococcus suis TaxID=1307 RepID=UPI0007691A78|nr:hypothetical protein [Streptococcus suis]CZA36947.1 Uncharacterised protein [Streptococcus suis]
MAYKVIRPFKDLTDPNKHDYALDETYPRDGHKPSDEFIQGLLTGSNSAGSIFLTTVDEAPEADKPAGDEVELPEGDKTTEEDPELPEDDKTTEEDPELPEDDKTTEEDPELPEGDKPADEAVEKPKRKRTTKKAEE